ncbi:MAG: type I-E CRISPR-associated protein Cse1/CasA [Shimia sp.]
MTGVVQRPWGASYAGWRHPLTPCDRVEERSEPRPVHPKPGLFVYRNRLGVVARAEDEGLRERATALAP